MKKFVMSAVIAGLALTAGTAFAQPSNPSDPQQFTEEFREYFYKRFPNIPKAEYNMGVYAILPDARAQWEAAEEFPPYMDAVDKGKKLWAAKFPNGKSFEECLGHPAKGLRAKYPFFDTAANKVRILESDLIACQKANGVEKPMDTKSKDLSALSAYLSYESRGLKVDVSIPNDAAVAAFNDGKASWYRKTGQLNLSCADCHQYHSGQNARAETLSPGIGKTVHFPVFRVSKDNIVRFQNRLLGCMRDTRAVPFPEFSPQFANLEYFLAYIDNGLEINGPAVRK
ncbi:MAG: sulfur oxidation c-type cytochrome SoxA [Halothiobacillaceae bacterium]|nr:sulfur oxidation c-type cytochrome SoxA [Halothiobacillaceae bacterium]